MPLIGKDIKFVIGFDPQPIAIETARNLKYILIFDYDLLDREQYIPKIEPKKVITNEDIEDITHQYPMNKHLYVQALCYRFNPSTKEQIISELKKYSREAFSIDPDIREEVIGLNRILARSIDEGYLKLKKGERYPTKDFYDKMFDEMLREQMRKDFISKLRKNNILV